MRRKEQAFTLIELLVVIAIIALLISILLPSLSRARELSKRLVCSSNIKGIGTSCKIYANDNNERWMIPPFEKSRIDEGGIDYITTNPTAGNPDITGEEGEIGHLRGIQSKSSTASFPNSGDDTVPPTRAFWMLVRSGDVTVNQFICPSSGDEEDKTENLELYYDFQASENVSYGYQVPFGPRATQPREGVDNRQILAADRGPFYTEAGGNPDWEGGINGLLTTNDAPKAWRRYNSRNHSANEGQNCLYADGHASFERKPIVGIDADNIYTLMTDEWGNEGRNRIHGETVHESAAVNPYPGQNAFGNGPGNYAATDTLIYP